MQNKGITLSSSTTSHDVSANYHIDTTHNELHDTSLYALNEISVTHPKRQRQRQRPESLESLEN